MARIVLRLCVISSPVNPSPRVEPCEREPFFVSQEKKVSDLLKEMQGRKAHMAIVVDEFSGVEGCVTLEDLEIGRAHV